MQSLKKPAILVLLTLLLLIPLAMIGSTIKERISYKQQATYSIINSWASAQIVQDPILVIEYEISGTVKNKDNITSAWKFPRTAIIKPDNSNLSGVLNMSERKRGIYTIPVYTADVEISSEFEIEKFFSTLSTKENFEFKSAYFVNTVSDAGGLDGNSINTIINQETTSTDPGTRALKNLQGFHTPISLATLHGNKQLTLVNEFSLRGAEAFNMSPNAKEAVSAVTSSWPHPSFSGDLLPLKRTILDSGFNANWEVSPYNSNISSKPIILDQHELSNYYPEYFGFGVNIFTPVDEYSLVNRSAKYGALMIILIFTGFYLFELLKGLKIHPVQYALVGLSLAVFFLLLLSLSEHLGFSIAYLIAASASSGLISFYLLPFAGRKATLFFLILLLVTYLACYLILFVEDHALLYGSLLIFAALASVMTLTRKIDWHKLDTLSPLIPSNTKEISL